jgi:hypothetical protein
MRGGGQNRMTKSFASTLSEMKEGLVEEEMVGVI